MASTCEETTREIAPIGAISRLCWQFFPSEIASFLFHCTQPKRGWQYLVHFSCHLILLYINYTIIHLIEDAPFLGLIFETSEET